MPLDPKKISDLQHPNTAPNKNLTLLETEEAGVSAHRTLTELLNQIDPRIISSLTQSGNVSGGDTLEVDQGGASYKLDLTKLKDWLLVQFGQENKVSSRPSTVANILDSTLILTEDSGTETQRTALQMYQYILSKLPTPRIKDDANGTTPLAGGHFIRTDDGSTQGKVTMGDVSTFVNSNLPEIDDLAPDTSPITDSVAVRIQRPSQTEKQSTALKLAEYMRIKNPVWHVPLLADGSSVTMDLHVAVSDGASGEVKHTLAEVFDAGEKRQVEVLKGKEQSLSPSSSFRVPLLLTQEQVTQLSDSSGKFQVGFGSAIATDGNVLAVGAYKDGSGVVYVYARNGSVWNQQATLTAPSGQSFGYALSVYGGRILVGAPDEANQSGKVFLFGASGSTWSVLNTFTASDGASNDKFGCSVSLTASRAIVGALGSGKAYVFKETTGVWSEEYKTAAISGAFGTKVSAYGSRFVVGAPEDGALAVNAGAVYVFDHNGTTWAQTTKITVPGSAIGEKVGVALELGENLFTSGGYKARAFVYELVSNAWVKRNDLISPNNDPLFGRHISLDGRSVWVSQASSSMSYMTKFEPSGQTWVVSNQVSHTFVGTTVSPIVGKGDYFFAGTEGDATNAGVVNQFNLTTTKTSVLTQTFGDYIEGKFHAKWGNRELPSSLASDEYKVVTQSAQGFYTIHGENLADRFLTYYKSQGEIGIPLIRNEQVGTTPLQDGHLIRVDTGTVQGKVTLQDLSNYMNYEINHPRIKDDPAGASPLQDGHFLRSDDGTTQGKITMLSLANFVKSKIPAALEIKDRVEDTTLTDTTFVLSQEGTDDQKRISLANVYGYIQSKWPATPQIKDRTEDTTPTDATLILTQEGTNPESKMTLANVYGYIQGKLPAPVVTMTGLTDTQLASLSTGQFLRYDAATSKWVNVNLTASDIPNLSTSKIVSGTLDVARVPDLDAGKITTGVFDAARIPVTVPVSNNTTNITNLTNQVSNLALPSLTDVTITGTASGNFLRHNGSGWVNVTLTEADIPSIGAAKITSGVLALARIPTIPQVTTNTSAIASLQTSLDGKTLVSLSDVAVANPNTGHILKWSAAASKWQNSAITGADIPNLDASKITTGTISINRIPTIPQVLTNQNDITTLQGSLTTLSNQVANLNFGGLTDVTLTSVAANQLVKYNSTTSKWENGVLAATDIPALDASKITSGVFDLARIPTIPQVTTNTNAIASLQSTSQSVTSLSDTEIATLANGHVLVYESATSKWKNRLLLASDVPNLDAAKITTGSFHVDRIPALDAAKITSGVLAVARIPTLPASSITSGVLGVARIPDLDASKITTGVLNLNRFPSIPNTLINGLGTMSTQNHTAVNIDGGDIAGISRLRVDSGSDTSELSILHSYSRGFAFNLTGNTNKLVSYSDATNATRTVFSTGRRGTAALPTNGVLGYDFNVGANTRLTIEDSVITATKSIRTMQPAGANVEVASFRRDADMFHFYIDGTTNHILSYSDPTNGKVLRLESRCTSNAVPTNNTLGIDFRVNSQEFMRMRLNENNVTISKDFNVVGASTNFNVTNAEVGLRRHAVLYNGAFIYMQPGKLGISQGSNWLRLNNSGHYTNGVYCANSIVRTDNQFQVNANGSTFRAHSSELRSNTGRLEFLVGGVSHFRIESGTNTIYTLPIDIKGNKLYFNTRNAIFDNGDGWLRLNQDNHFTNGVYTPYLIRSELRIIAGNEGTKFVRADQTRLTCNTTNQAILMSQTNSSNIVNGGGATGQLELRSNTKTGGAYMASLIFHRPTAFACHLGIDESYNGLKVGGWSYGTNSYKVWTEHNLQWPVAWSSGSGRRIVFTGGAGNGLVFWGNAAYSIYMSPDADTTWGGSIDPTSDYNMYFKMHYNTRGWCFKQAAATGGIAAQINGRGDFYNMGQLCTPSRSLSYGSSTTHIMNPWDRITYIYGAATSSLVQITLTINTFPNKSCGPIYVFVKTSANQQTRVNIDSAKIKGIWNGSSPKESWTVSPSPDNTLLLTFAYCENLNRYYVVSANYYT